MTFVKFFNKFKQQKLLLKAKIGSVCNDKKGSYIHVCTKNNAKNFPNPLITDDATVNKYMEGAKEVNLSAGEKIDWRA